jgi:hypothetical protein
LEQRWRGCRQLQRLLGSRLSLRNLFHSRAPVRGTAAVMRDGDDDDFIGLGDVR